MHKTVLQILSSFIFLNFWPDVTGNTDSMNSCQGNSFRQFITQSVRLNILHQPLSWSCNATVFNTILPRLPVGKNDGPNCSRARCAGDGEASHRSDRTIPFPTPSESAWPVGRSVLWQHTPSPVCEDSSSLKTKLSPSSKLHCLDNSWCRSWWGEIFPHSEPFSKCLVVACSLWNCSRHLGLYQRLT